MLPGRKGSHARIYVPTQLWCRAAQPHRGSVESFLPLLLLKCQPLVLTNQMADSMAPRRSCFPYDVISLLLWARSSAGTNHNSSLGFTAAMGNYSCWLQLLRIQPVPNKEPSENLSSWRWLPKIQMHSCRPKSKSGLWCHCSPLCHWTSALNLMLQ